MKNFFIFIAGMITMFIIILLIGAINQYGGDGYPGLTIFEKEGACINNAKQIKIFQTLESDLALAHTQKKMDAFLDLDDTLVLILGAENTHFYDEQKITIPNGKCAKQVGTYQYNAKNGVMKTVPAVVIK